MAKEAEGLPSFFRRCFHPFTLSQLLYLRHSLRWSEDEIDRFIAAITLGCLHGDVNPAGSYMSNQMPRVISPKPGYALHFWRRRGLWPPRRDVFALLESRVRYRLRAEIPAIAGIVRLSDSRSVHESFRDLSGRVKLVVTSPPYLDVTDGEEDQWLRRWFLGQKPTPGKGHDTQHIRKASVYWQFLTETWASVAKLLAPEAVIVCRIGARSISEEALIEGFTNSVQRGITSAKLQGYPVKSDIERRQTQSFHPGSAGCRYELDFTFVA